uniref:Inosine/uridine-preferring nucleoside hydrolase domain-containing protein n=1 Tax=Rhizophora mucronata TaxID=61149 RepID=A0A2P2KN23_RHIMU
MLFGFSDDAMAIFLALRSPEVEVIGLTTVFGNVYTTLSTRNALHLVSHLSVTLRLLYLQFLTISLIHSVLVVFLSSNVGDLIN